MELILSVDDFSLGNIELAKIIKGYGLEDKTIFFIELSGKRLETKGKTKEELVDPANKVQIEKLSDMGFSCFSHNIFHDNSLKEKSFDEQFNQIFRSKEILEELTGKECKGYCFNRGRYNDQILQLVKDAGYEWSRTTKVFDIEPIKEGINHTTFHLCPIRPEYEEKGMDKIFEEQLARCIEKKGCFKYWLHYAEMEKYNLRDKFEEHLQQLSKLV